MKNAIIVSILCGLLSISLGFGAMIQTKKDPAGDLNQKYTVTETYLILNLDQENAGIENVSIKNALRDQLKQITDKIVVKYFSNTNRLALGKPGSDEGDFTLENIQRKNIENNISSMKNIFNENKSLYLYIKNPELKIYHVIGYQTGPEKTKPSSSWLQSFVSVALPTAALAAWLYIYLNYWKTPSSLNNYSMPTWVAPETILKEYPQQKIPSYNALIPQ